MTSSKVLNLTDDEVYYGNEANWQYMSVSQYKDFIKCEAAALAKLKGDWEPISDPKALLVGNYVHSYFEGEDLEKHREFCRENADVIAKEGTKAEFQEALELKGVEFKKSANKDVLKQLLIDNDIPIPMGEMLSDFKVADKMIERLEEDPFFQFLWQGNTEVPITGELYGVEWKGKIDLLNVEKGYFVDLKTSRDFGVRYWDEDRSRYVSFVDAFGYTIQIGIYEKLLEMKYGKPFEGFIFAVSKETPPNIEAIHIERPEKDFDLGLVQQRIDRVEKVKTGQEEPEMCGKCEYCREYKQLEGFKYPGQLIID